ncbi:hypothetical protein MMC09_002033 [Bachmanniomyces sp. S44760]|nr:hypothetical protein [Bachmanniomyces sp. S44760]
MSLPHPPRNLTSNLRSTSLGTANPNSGISSSTGPQTQGQSPILLARISEKRAELESLKQLRDLSGALAAQMGILEEKLATLSNGTEAVATVLSNWHNVLRAINMASAKLPAPKSAADDASIPPPQQPPSEVPLPQTLVRIPVHLRAQSQPQSQTQPQPQPESHSEKDDTSDA